MLRWETLLPLWTESQVWRRRGPELCRRHSAFTSDASWFSHWRDRALSLRNLLFLKQPRACVREEQCRVTSIVTGLIFSTGRYSRIVKATWLRGNLPDLPGRTSRARDGTRAHRANMWSAPRCSLISAPGELYVSSCAALRANDGKLVLCSCHFVYTTLLSALQHGPCRHPSPRIPHLSSHESLADFINLRSSPLSNGIWNVRNSRVVRRTSILTQSASLPARRELRSEKYGPGIPTCWSPKTTRKKTMSSEDTWDSK